MDELTKSLNHIYKFEIENEKVKPPTIEFPDHVKDRVNFFCKYIIDGLTFIGCLNFILAYDEEEQKKEFEIGAYEDWMPISQEFKEWRDMVGVLRDQELAVAILYGFEGMETDED